MTDLAPINGREILKEIRAGLPDFVLMRKYQLTAAGMQEVYRLLVNSKSLTWDEIQGRTPEYRDEVSIRGIREVSRHKAHFPVAIRACSHGDFEGFICDLSERGICVEGVSCEVGETVTFAIEDLDAPRVEATGFEAKCRWIRRDGEALRGVVGGFEIIHISYRSFRRLKVIIGAFSKARDEDC